jgi:parallel beta-helix repeat protein
MLIGLICFWVMVILGARVVCGANYYVTNTGNDDSTGTSVAGAWAHHPDANTATSVAAAVTLAAGDTVFMALGDVWWDTTLDSKTAGTAGAPIVTTSKTGFGTGSLPQINGAALLDGEWTDTTVNGEYKIALTTECKTVYNGDTMLTKGTAGSLGDNGWVWVLSELYVKIGGNPTGGTIHASSRQAVKPDQNYRNYENLDLRYGKSRVVYNGAATTGTTIKNCTVSRGDDAGIRLYTCTNPIVSGCAVLQAISGSYGIYISDGGTGGSVINNTVTATGAACGIVNRVHIGLLIDGNTITGGTEGIENKSNWQTITNNTLSNQTDYGIVFIDADSSNVSRNTISDIWNTLLYGAGGAGTGISITATSEGNTIKNNNISDCYLGITQHVTTGADGNQYTYNLIKRSMVNNIGIMNTGVNAPLIANNTTIARPIRGSDGDYHGHSCSFQNGAVVGIMINNIIYGLDLTDGGTKEADFIQINSDSSYYSFTVNNNLFFDSSEGATTWSWRAMTGGTGNIQKMTTFAAYKDSLNINDGIIGKEANSLTGDPLFRSETLGDYHLLRASPARNTGVTISGLTTDYDGKPIVGTPDMGSFEVQDYYMITPTHQMPRVK